jgi:hypothetical protein
MNNNSSQVHFSSPNNTNQQQQPQFSPNHQLTQPLFTQQPSSLETFALKQLQAQPFLPGQNPFK